MESLLVINDQADNLVSFFCYDQEPLIYNNNKDLFQKVHSLIPKHFYRKEIHVKSKILDCEIKTMVNVAAPFILLNTERHSEEKKQIFKEFDFIDCYYFFHALAASDWYRGYQYRYDLKPPQQRKLRKKYISFNRITGHARSHRSLFVAQLQKLSLLDQGYISYSEICPVHGHYKNNLISLIDQYGLSASFIHECIQELDKINFPLRIDNPNSEYIANCSEQLGPVKELSESFLHVVTETCFWENKEHLTEKIFKPIVARQPFVLIGCVQNLNYLKSYGFKTFDQWWDESYDQIDDPIQRLNAVVKIINDICKLSLNDLQNLLQQMQDTLDYNYNRFYSKEFLDLVWNELEENLKQAIAQLPPQIFQEI